MKFTKNHTTALKGIAILFLLCYHSFSREFRLNGVDVDFWPLEKGFAMACSNVMVICVGIFVFLSVYGLTLSMKKRFVNYEFTDREAVLYVLRRYLTILFMFLIPFIFCEAVTAVMGFSRYGDVRIEKAGNFAADLLGLGEIFGTDMLVGTWWYISLLVLLTVFMPLLLRGYKRYSWLLVVMFLLIGSLLAVKNVNMTKWLFTVPIAICFADQAVLERMREFHMVSSDSINKLLKFLISTPLLLAVIKLQTSDWIQDHAQFAIYGIVTTVLIYWCYEFVIDLPVIKEILCFLGRHSGDIFYVHSFIRGVWFRKELYSLRYAVLIFLVLLISSLGISIMFDLIRKVTKYQQNTGKLTGWLLEKAENSLWEKRA